MNDKFTNNAHDDEFERKLTEIAEQTHASGHFGAELEEKLRNAYQPRTGWWMTFNQVSPTLRWVGLMVLLALVLSWSIRSLIPAPQPAVENTPATPGLSTPLPDDSQISTPAPEGEGIDFRGAKLFMNVTLPDSPEKSNIYQVIQPQPATAEYAQSLAEQFGINGDIYLTPGQIPDSTAYMVTDGKQQLVVFAENNYTYSSDMVASARTYNGAENDNAEAIIRDFLQSHGFNTNVKLTDDAGSFSGYALKQLTPDGLPIEYENYSQPSVRIILKETGEVLGMTVVMVNYDPKGLGSFGIISAEEALQLFLDDNISAGKLETNYGGGLSEDFDPPQIWYHEYPNDQTVTIYGNISSSKAVDPATPAIVFIDSVQAIGNIAGMDALEYYTFIQATGQYVVQDGVRKFNVESWDANIESSYVFGTTRRQGDQIMAVNEDGSGTEYTLVDPPADLPLDTPFPDTPIAINGAIVNEQLHWTMITYYPDGGFGGGGGGGGGMGFYQLNLSGSPIPFPTATAAGTGPTYTAAELASFLKYTVKEGDTAASIAAAFDISMSELGRVNNLNSDFVLVVGQVLTIPNVPGPTRFDGEEGVMQVQIFQKPDGRIREAYTFISKKDQTYYQVQGEGLQELQAVAHRPIRIWGTLSYDEMGIPFLTLEKFESLYPDLQFEILRGTQQITQINGGDAVLFVTDGTTYIQMSSSGGYPDYSTYEGISDINLEVLRIPGEMYAGYPALRVFSSGPAVNNVTGEEMGLPGVTENLEIMPDPYGNADAYVYPDLTLEQVELVYLTNNPGYRDYNNPDAAVGQGYIQPAWHLRGRYSNGDVLDVLVQALRQEYLSPEFSPPQAPG